MCAALRPHSLPLCVLTLCRSASSLSAALRPHSLPLCVLTLCRSASSLSAALRPHSLPLCVPTLCRSASSLSAALRPHSLPLCVLTLCSRPHESHGHGGRCRLVPAGDTSHQSPAPCSTDGGSHSSTTPPESRRIQSSEEHRISMSHCSQNGFEDSSCFSSMFRKLSHQLMLMVF